MPHLPRDTVPVPKVSISGMDSAKCQCVHLMWPYFLPLSLQEAINKLMVCLELRNFGRLFFLIDQKGKNKEYLISVKIS